MTTIKTIAAALALTAAISAPALSAQGTAQGTTKANVAVTFADLNLNSEQGRTVLDRRIERAVEKVCGHTTGKIAMDRAVKDCQRKTAAAAQQSRDLAVADYSQNRLAKADSKVIRLVAQ